MTRVRNLTWIVTGVLIVAAGRQIAYALTGGSLADRLSSAGGGPGVEWVAAVALAGSALATLVGLWLLACGVRERCELELAGWATTTPRLHAGVLVRRALVLSAATTAAFTMFESTLHYEEGLGFHGWHCIAGPVHQNAAPILIALSLIAAACVTAAEFLLAGLRRAVARLLLSRRPAHPRPLRRRSPRSLTIARDERVRANFSRGPPRSSLV
ncbi:MAG: hypothetical protein ACRDP6_25380 [Actinoallomurus sp.]